MKRLAILTGGGDAPGLNAVIPVQAACGTRRAAQADGAVWMRFYYDHGHVRMQLMQDER